MILVAGYEGYGGRGANPSQQVAQALDGASIAGHEVRGVGELLELVGLAGFQNRRVAQLSGGEQQRVAIARALAPRPAILLLDEPLSALDEKIRREMQAELRAIQQRTGTTFIYVTHDQEEALTMSDRIAVLNAGQYVQCDAPKAIFRRPRTPFVARFFRGCNVLEADLDPVSGGTEVRLAGASVTVPGASANARRGHVAVRGETIRLGEAAYQLLDFMLGGWYGATISGMRGYMTNPLAPAYAAANPSEFDADAAAKVAGIDKGVQEKFAVGGTWQNRWPTNVDLYEEEWQRFKAA